MLHTYMMQESYFVERDDLDASEYRASFEARCAKMRKAAEINNWITISMKNDFKTIYGDNVKRKN